MQFWEKNFETSVAICFAAGFVHSCIFFKAFYVWNSAWVVFRAFVVRHRHKMVAFSINIKYKTSSFQASLTFKATATTKQWNVEPNISEKGPAWGAGSEVWNRVYLIAPVKKFDRVRLSTNFPSKQIWRKMRTWKDDEFLLGFTFYGVQTSRKGFHELFSWNFWKIRRRDVWTVHEWLRSPWFGTLASSVIYKLREFSSDQPQGSLLHLLYIFSPTVVLRTLCLILNICYELIIVVWVLQQSYGNVH